jgi:hypothetical protein
MPNWEPMGSDYDDRSLSERVKEEERLERQRRGDRRARGEPERDHSGYPIRQENVRQR